MRMMASNVAACALTACVLSAAGARADAVAAVQDFDTWPVTWEPDPYLGESPQSVYTNDGWTLHEGILSEDAMNLWPPRSEPLMAWLVETGTNGPSCLESPYLANGLARVAFYSMNFLNGYNAFSVLFSTNGVTWETLATFTNSSGSASWVAYEVLTERFTPGWVRIVKTGGDSASQRMGLDDVTLYHPAGATLTNLVHAPDAPTIDDAVHVYASVSFHPNAANRMVRLHYRFEGDPGFSQRPMALTTGTIYRTETPIPAGRVGEVTYFVEAAYTGVTDGPQFIPAGGQSNAASYTVVDTGGGAPVARQFAPSSRGTPLVISEIMYHPPSRPDGWDLEFVEIYNSDPTTRDMGGYRLSGEIDYTFPDGTMLPPGRYLVVAKTPPAIGTLYPVSGVLGPFTGSLSNGGGTLRLRNQMDAVLQEVDYDDRLPWPIAADGAGHSLVCLHPDYGEGNVKAWFASQRRGGSPGYALPEQTDALARVVINEVLTHTDSPDVDYVELYNANATAVDLVGCVITDNPTTNRFVITNTTVVAAHGRVAFDADTLGFGLSMSGGDVFLVSPAGDRVIDAVRFGAQENGVPFGRFPDGAPEFAPLAAPTAGTANSGLRDADVVINEIMFHPISNDDDDEYVELHNKSAAPVDVGYWQFVDGIDYLIPPGTVIPAGGYLVVARDRARTVARYPQLTVTNTVGDFAGRLSNRGERLALARPDDIAEPFLNLVLVDDVTYGDGHRWGAWADGGGSSLELVDPHSDNRRAMNWDGSDETRTDTNTWTLVEHTGVLDLGRGTADELHVLLETKGECLVDSIEVRKTGGSNLIPNGTFESGLTDWIIQGTHIDSTLETTDGYQSARSLHVRNSGKGDNGVNRIETDLTTALASGDTATIRARVRWLCGSRNILLRLHGNWLEAPGRLRVPATLGTPGEANSRYASNAGPAIWDVTHAPVLPPANTPVTVLARAHDPDGLQQVAIKWRDDPDTTVQTVLMSDDGTGGDAVANDGLYSGQIPGQPAGDHVAFYLEMVDTLNATNRFPRDAPDRENVVYFGQTAPDTEMGVYRFWMTQAVQDEWSTRQKLSDHRLPGTFVYGDVRVVYEAAGRYRGSPFIRRSGDPESLDTSFVFYVPKDDRVLGSTSFNIDRLEGDDAQQRERMSLWMADQIDTPYFAQRYTRLYIDERARGLFGDSQQPNDDFALAWWSDADDGDLHKIDDWFEFNDNAQVNKEFNVNGQLVQYLTTGGEKKKARYRWSWRKEPVATFDDDYTNFFAMVDAQNLTPNTAAYAARVPAMVDAAEWMQVFAVRHMIRDWDSYGYNRGKNMSTYRPEGGKWRMIMWDLDHSHLTGSATDNNLFSINCPTMRNRFFVHTPFLRAYWRAYRELVDGPMRAEQCEPVMDQNYAFLTGEGFSVVSPDIALKAWVQTRRDFLIGKLASVGAPLAITTNGGEDFSTADRLLALTGTAPVNIERLRLNGVERYDVAFDSVTDWSMTVELTPGTNVLTVDGVDSDGVVTTNAPQTIAVVYTGQAVSPAGQLVINEIMYHAPGPREDFIELYNRSATETFHLGGMRLNGLDYTFRDGTYIGPDSYLLVADNTPTYAVTYTNAEVLAGDYPGDLDNGGETISLLMPEGTNWVVLDRVRYDDSAPWPTAADGWGPSLQLRDADRDNNRIANWGVDTLARCTPGAPNSLATSLPPLPRVWINEVMPDNAGYATDAAGDYDPWVELYNGDSNAVSLGGTFYLSNTHSNLQAWPVPGGWSIDAGGHLVVWADGETNETSGTELHADMVLNAQTGTVVLTWTGSGMPLVLDGIDYAYVPTDTAFGYYPDGDGDDRLVLHTPSPGTANVSSSIVVHVRINEWMARNSTTLEDPAATGEFDDWIELYNPTPETVNLTGFHLTDDLSDADKFTIPLGTTLDPHGFLIVWADNDDNQNAPGSVHTSFALNGSGETIGLFAPDGSAVDSVAFGEQLQDISEGRWLDGWGAIYPMAIPTPEATNVVFRLETISDAGSNAVHLRWNTRPGWWYQLWRQPSMQTNTTWAPIGDPREGTGAAMTTNVPSAAAPAWFYRVEQIEP